MIRKDNIGTELLGTVRDQNGTVIDLTGATLRLYLQKPSGTTVTKTPALKTDGTDGRWSYVSVSGDFNEVGSYSVQFAYALSGASLSSDPYSFQVGANLNG